MRSTPGCADLAPILVNQLKLPAPRGRQLSRRRFELTVALPSNVLLLFLGDTSNDQQAFRFARYGSVHVIRAAGWLFNCSGSAHTLLARLRVAGKAGPECSYRRWLALFAAGINGNDSFPDFTFGPIGAPNNIGNPQSSVISDFASGGDPPAGEQGLVVFSDYDSGLHSDPNDPRDLVISIFQEQTIATSDIGKVAVFDFLAEGNANPPSGDAIVEAFMLTLDPNNGFVVTNNLSIDTSNVPDGDPTPLQISLSLANPALDGQILQFGFRNTSQNGDGTAVDYDNVSLSVVPEPTGLALAAVGSVVALAFARRRHR